MNLDPQGVWQGNTKIEHSSAAIGGLISRNGGAYELGPPHKTATRTAESLAKDGWQGIYAVPEMAAEEV